MSNASGTPEHDPLSAYRASEPRRTRNPFANPTVRSEIARIAEARAQRAASGWRSVLFGWVSAAPRGALAGAALSGALLLGGVAGQLAGSAESAARMETGADPLASSLAPEASMEVKADGASDEILASGALDGAAIVSGAALLLLTGSLAVVFVSVRRRRA
ncbi:MAG: hypothetical protein JHD27_05445 [Chloroflexi bacterium]|nr:hypothetical protein [Chloroflexota bacterium]